LPTRSATFDAAVKYFNENGKTALAEMFPIFQASLAEARTPPLIPQWIEVSNVLWPQLQAAIVGEKTPQEALDQAAAEATTIMEDAGILVQ
ncbi:MAG TPA: sugar ABC transporter substrate-binding protein, partial [Devosia sp.]|nr:sugar ABC transporter substrate-binding protein [Devosia sp.]